MRFFFKRPELHSVSVWGYTRFRYRQLTDME